MSVEFKVKYQFYFSQEFESMKVELATCKRELEELKESYKALDEECETCAEYLREREQQCQKLKEAKAALEVGRN